MGAAGAVRWMVAVLALLLGGCGSSDGNSDAASVGWACPAEWVPYARGGCGPAVLLCVPDGGAAVGACDGVDLARPQAVTDGDGGTTTSFYRLPDGAIAGPWHEPGEPGGPPNAGWTPSGVPATDWVPDASSGRGTVWAPTGAQPDCPADWTPDADGTCAPTLRGDCPTGSAALPGGTCTATSEIDCPSGAYADVGAESIGAIVVRVRAGADGPSADGTEARPYPTIAQGMQRAGRGGWVLVAAGRYAESVVVNLGVHLIGQCAAHVTLDASGTGAALGLHGVDTTLDIRGFTIRGGTPGLLVDTAARLTARSVRIDGATSRGIFVTGAGSRADIVDTVVQDTRSEPDGTRGRGVEGRAGASVSIRRFAAVGSRDSALLISDAGTVATLATSTARETHVLGDQSGGEALWVQNGGRLDVTDVLVALNESSGCVSYNGGALTATRAYVTDNRRSGAVAFGAGTQLDLTDTVLRRTRAQSPTAFGAGLYAEEGARVTATRVAIDANEGEGAVALGAGSRIDLTDTLVRGTRPVPGAVSGHGIGASDGAAIVGVRVLVTGNAATGASAQGRGSSLTIRDSTVRDTNAREGGVGGEGLEASGGASLVAERVLLDANTYVGALAAGSTTELQLIDAVVRGTRPLPDNSFGRGVQAQDGAHVIARRVRVSDNSEFGVAARDPASRIELTDALVRSTRPSRDGSSGHGLHAQSGAHLAATGVLVTGSGEYGAVALGEQSRLELSRSVVQETQSRPDGALGSGLGVEDGGELVASMVLVLDSVNSGATAKDPGSRLDLVDCVVHGTRPRDAGVGGGGTGVQALDGGTLTALRSVVEDAVVVGGFALGAGARLELADSVIRRTHLRGDDLAGSGLVAASGATLRVTRTLVSQHSEWGIGAFGAESHLEVTDAIVSEIHPTLRGLGFGVVVSDGAQGTFARLAVAHVAGAGVAATFDPRAQNPTGASAHLDHTFVQAISASTVLVSSTPVGGADREVAYGLHTGVGCSVSAEHIVVDDGAIGAFSAGGAIVLRNGVIARQSVAAAARSSLGTPADLLLEAVLLSENGQDTVLIDDTYPAARLETATSCAMPPCL